MNDPGLRAFLQFQIKWSPESFDGLRYAEEMLDQNVVFRLDEPGRRMYLHERPAARRMWAAYLSRATSKEKGQGFCLVTGERSEIARTHPLIKGVSGAQSSGAPLSSADTDGTAFHSFGKMQGFIGPVSEQAASAYAAALNHLLRPDSPQKVQIGDMTVIFWADTSEAEEIASALLGKIRPTDKGQAEVVRSILVQMERGQPIDDTLPSVQKGVRFFALGLSPNAGRISIRFWLQSTLGELAKHFVQHWQDLALDLSSRMKPPSVNGLVYELSPTSQRKGKKFWDITSQKRLAKIAGDLTRSIITGQRYPGVLLVDNLIRLRADGDVADERAGRTYRAMSGTRISMIKGYLVRKERFEAAGREMGVVGVASESRQSVRLGKLFALFERAQSAAIGNVNSTIRDRYYGSASTIPRIVFPFLLKNYRNHHAILRKGRGGEWVKKPKELAYWLDAQIGEIVSNFNDGWPGSLSYDDQGWFAIGYYKERHQRKDVPDDIRATQEAEAADAIDTSNED